jgi:hypothetical protein
MTALFGSCVTAGDVVVIVASPCLSQISPFRDGSKKRSASTSLTPSLPATTKPTFLAPGLSFTYANRPYASSPVNGCPAGQVVVIDGSTSPKT